jgi:hypothetical protein
MTELAGWATHQDEQLAHQVEQVSRNPEGWPVYGSLCGRTSSPFDWEPAGPAVTRCAACQNRAAGTPD